MSWWDRVLAKPAQAVPPDAIPGRYLVAEDVELLMHGVPARARDHLAASPSGEWSASVPHEEADQGQFSSAEMLRVLESDTLLAISERLDPEGGGFLDWSRLTTESPLIHPTPEQIEPTHIDREIARHGPHLLEVFRRPHTVLDVIVEPTLASRAKRIPPRAVQYLAGHSEDWHRRTVTSVIPRRVLAQRVDERLDVYENRVAARLTDRLVAYFRSRLADLRQLGDLFADVADFSGELRAQHWVAWRLSELWGEGFGGGDELERIERLEHALLDRRRQVGGLQDSELYRAVPKRARVAGELRMTNVLVDHQHYRRVAALWRAFGAERTSVASRQDEYIAWQKLMRSFDAYCLLLVSAAVRQLGFVPTAGGRIALARSGEVQLNGPRGALDLRWDSMRGVTIEHSAGAVIRFVPLAAALAGADEGGATEANERRAAARADELTRGAPHEPAETPAVLLYPGTRRQRGALPSDLGRRFNPDDVGLSLISGDDSPALLPVSPLDILSLERVERVVRRVVLVGLFDQFPPAAECRRNVRGQLTQMATWLSASDSLDSLSVLEPPDEERLDGLRKSIKQAKSGLRPRHDDAIRDSLEAFLPEVEQTQSFFERVCRCPVCDGQGSFVGRGAAHFLVRCDSCESSWGLASCGGCGARVPYLATGAKGPTHRERLELDLLDREHGRDVLAVPCLREGEADAYVCPACRGCPGGEESCGPRCARANLH